MTPTTWRGLAIPIPGGQVILSRRAVALLLLLVRSFQRRFASEAPLTRELQEIVMALEVAIRPSALDMSDEGHADADMPPAQASSERLPTAADDAITTTEVGRRLGLSPRQARRLIKDTFGLVGVKRVGRAFALTEDQMAVLAAARTEKQ